MVTIHITEKDYNPDYRILSANCERICLPKFTDIFLLVSLFVKSLMLPFLRLILFLQHPYIPGLSLLSIVRFRVCYLLGSQLLLSCWEKDEGSLESQEVREQGRWSTTLAQLDIDFFCSSQVCENNFRCVFHLPGEPVSWQYLLIRSGWETHAQPHPWLVSDIKLLYNPTITFAPFQAEVTLQLDMAPSPIILSQLLGSPV